MPGFRFRKMREKVSASVAWAVLPAVVLAFGSPAFAQDAADAKPAVSEPAPVEKNKTSETTPAETKAPWCVKDPFSSDPRDCFALSTPAGAATPVSGWISNRYRARWTSGSSDQDYYGLFNLGVGDSTKDRVTARMLARVSVDLDGHQNPRGFYSYDNLADPKNGRADGRFYDGYIDINRVKYMETIRLGRQTIYTTPEMAYVDGAYAESRWLARNKVQTGGYIGVPVRTYGQYSDGKLIAGLFGQARPWYSARARIDWMHVNDYFYGKHHNDLFRFSGWQTVAHDLMVDGYFTVLEKQGRDVMGRLTYNKPEWELLAQVSYQKLLHPENQLALEFDRFSATLFELMPYHDIRAMISKGFFSLMIVEAGMQLRRLDRVEYSTQFNREFSRGYSSVTFTKVFIDGLSLNGTIDYWRTPDPTLADRKIVTGGGELAYKKARILKASVGTSYALYKYDYYLKREQSDVRSYYGRFWWRFADHFRLDMKYEFDDDSFGHYQEFNGALVWELGGQS